MRNGFLPLHYYTRQNWSCFMTDNCICLQYIIRDVINNCIQQVEQQQNKIKQQEKIDQNTTTDPSYSKNNSNLTPISHKNPSKQPLSKNSLKPQKNIKNIKDMQILKPAKNPNKKISEQSLIYTVQADTFNLQAQFYENSLLIKLKDYVDWRKYEIRLTGQCVGKEINSVLDLQDIYFAFGASYQQQRTVQKSQFIKYKFGQIIQKNKCSAYSIQKNGIIIISNKVSIQKPCPINKIHKTLETKLKLTCIGQFKQQERYDIIRELARKQMQDKFKDEIVELKGEIQKLRAKMKQSYREKMKPEEQIKQTQINKLTIYVKGNITQNCQILPLNSLSNNNIDLTFKCSQNSTITKIKQHISGRINIPAQKYMLKVDGITLDDKKTLKEQNISNGSTLLIVSMRE